MKGRTYALLALGLWIASCDDKGDGEATTFIQTIKVGSPFAEPDHVPPVGLTWFIRFNDNVSQSDLEAFYTKVAACSADLWNVTEGQVYIARVIISDNVAPGLLASDLPPPTTTLSIDTLVYTDATWDIAPVLGFLYLYPLSGRNERIIGVPESVASTTLVHEASHLLFRLSWSPGPLLVDEYADGVQDAACIMDAAFVPLKWCSAANHVAQSAQPTSCWQQILADYPTFDYDGTDVATRPVPPTRVDYGNVP